MDEANSPVVLFEWKPKDGIVFAPKLFLLIGSLLLYVPMSVPFDPPV